MLFHIYEKRGTVSQGHYIINNNLCWMFKHILFIYLFLLNNFSIVLGSLFYDIYSILFIK